MGNHYTWKNKPRILTYTNPREIDKNKSLMKIISSYPHLCASDTLLMGLTYRYSRARFTFLTTVEFFIDNLFNQIVNSKELALQKRGVCRTLPIRLAAVAHFYPKKPAFPREQPLPI